MNKQVSGRTFPALLASLPEPVPVSAHSGDDPGRTLAAAMQPELDRTGWTKANAHFDAACKAVLNHDDEAFNRHMASFRAIAGKWEMGK